MGKAEIAQRIKAARLAKGLTQADVAQKLGITPQAISNFERGKNRISNDILRSLCELYDISADIILDNTLAGKIVLDEKGCPKVKWDYLPPIRPWVKKNMDFSDGLYKELKKINSEDRLEFLTKKGKEINPSEIEFFLAKKLYENKKEDFETINLILDALPDDSVLRIENTKTIFIALYNLKFDRLGF